MVCVGTNLANSRHATELSERYEGLYASVGIHPSESGDIPLELAKHSKVVAIGEIGLDYYHAGNKTHQKELFERQLKLASEINKPVIIHCRDAHDDMLCILKAENISSGVIHSFNGTSEQARAYLELGLFVGLNAIVTFSDQYKDMIRVLPIERILLETDAPYLAPAPYRGRRNEPLYIEAAGNQIAEILGITPSELFSATTKNAERLFGIRV
jgi:TatD DNase family protein